LAERRAVFEDRTALPADTRSKERVDDRRVISGIIHVLKSGGRWIDAPPVYGPRKTLYNRFVRWADKGIWVGLFKTLAQSGGPALHLMIDSSAVKAHRSAAGGREEKNQAIGRSRGGRTTKIHALTDELCRPIAFMITGGNVADCTARAALLDQLPDCDVVHADKGYDANALRQVYAHEERRSSEEDGR
jgi:transposase